MQNGVNGHGPKQPAPAVEVTPPEETIAALPEDPVEGTPVPAPAETGATNPASDDPAVEPPVPVVDGDEVSETGTDVDETIAGLTPPVVAVETPDILDLLAEEEAGPET